MERLAYPQLPGRDALDTLVRREPEIARYIAGRYIAGRTFAIVSIGQIVSISPISPISPICPINKQVMPVITNNKK